MEEKITIRITKNDCLDPKTHSVGAMLDAGNGVSICYPYHREDQLGNFNEAARLAFDNYIEGQDLTPKKKDLYSGKIVFIDTKHEVNKCRFGTAIYNVIDGTIPELCLPTLSKDLRIEKNMTCSDLYKRVIDMYFNYGINLFDKVMYANGLNGSEL